MYQLNRIELNNFASYEKLEYSFSPNKVILLTGENKTDDGQESNGSGKTFLIEAIVFSLLGQSFRKINDSDLIRKGCDEANIVLNLVNTQTNSKLTISRSIFTKKSSKISLFINGEEKTDLPTVLDYNKYILELLKLTKDDILNFFIISKMRYTSFFSSSDTAKKELIARFSKSNLIDGCSESISGDVNEFTNLKTNLERDLISINSKLEVLTESKNENEDDLRANFLEEKKRSINSLVFKVDNLTNSNYSIEEEIRGFSDDIKRNKEKLKSLQDSFDNFQSNDDLIREKVEFDILLKSIEKDASEASRIIREYKSIEGDILNKLSSSIICPSCSYEFTLSSDKSIEDLKADLEVSQKAIEDQKQLLLEYQENMNLTSFEVKRLNDEIANLNLKKSKIASERNSVESLINRLSSDIKSNERRIESNSSIIESSKQEIKRLEAQEFSFNKTDNSAKINDLKNQLVSKEKELLEINESIQFLNEQSLLFKSFKNHLSNKSLNSINKWTNFYLDKLKSNLKIRLDGFKELKGGKISEKIEAYIEKDGEESGNFFKLSSGEQTRVEIATIFAVSKLLNESCSEFNGGLDLVIIDEVLESLDSKGLSLVLNAMSDLNQSCILVTHGKVELNDGFDVIKIIKENGKSRI